MKMPSVEITPLLVNVVAQPLAILAIMIAGFLVMFGAWGWAGRALLLALLFIAIAVLGPNGLPRP